MEKLIHLLIPRSTNNYKARLLHNSVLFVISLILIVFQLGIDVYKKNGNVLGFAANISRDEVIRLTNLKRSEAGLSPLVLNETLSNAAYAKGRDMLSKDYWAHTAPDGTEPWAFFNSLGYRYRYAGENLARDFSNANSAVDAWMASPTHRDNILNPKYKEIGIGVIEGDLAGSDTTLIVQFFGTRYADTVKPSVASTQTTENKTALANDNNAVAENIKKVDEEIDNKVNTVNTDSNENKDVVVTTNSIDNFDKNELVLSGQDKTRVLVSPFVATKNTSLIIVSTLSLVFLVDWFIVSRRRIARITGKTFAHIAYLGMIFAVLLILKAGNIV